eukprot:TRINITY_DN4995_c0_g2_i1.p1 TRINITY_DN4995_c0_g2~~TRINITY_DN4995_c0_g2_i1.p1  ORF type:complete len:608 (-),score=111.80 TRINITY_DN4995_c0_g2_i1:106-1929(-)
MISCGKEGELDKKRKRTTTTKERESESSSSSENESRFSEMHAQEKQAEMNDGKKNHNGSEGHHNTDSFDYYFKSQQLTNDTLTQLDELIKVVSVNPQLLYLSMLNFAHAIISCFKRFLDQSFPTITASPLDNNTHLPLHPTAIKSPLLQSFFTPYFPPQSPLCTPSMFTNSAPLHPPAFLLDAEEGDLEKSSISFPFSPVPPKKIPVQNFSIPSSNGSSPIITSQNTTPFFTPLQLESLKIPHSQLNSHNLSPLNSHSLSPRLISIHQTPKIPSLPTKGTYAFRDHLDKVDWGKTSMRDFDILTELGHGAYGVVRLCVHHSTGIPFAVKILDRRRILCEKQIEQISNERKAMFSLQHPFIVKLFASFASVNYFFFLMEFVPYGELFSLLREEGGLNNSIAVLVAAELVLVLQYLHEKNIIFRDLKSENILVDELGHIKLIDFGCVKQTSDRTMSVGGTFEYMAPEIIKGEGHDKGVDWWSLGIVIYHLLNGSPPFTSSPAIHTMHLVSDNSLKFDPDRFSPESEDLIRKLLTIDRNSRLGSGPNDATEIMRHPWFKHVHWENILDKKEGPLYGLKGLKFTTGHVPVHDVPGLSSESSLTFHLPATTF